MFKKLKQKISEEQQQLQQALAPTQASSSSSTPTRSRSRASSFTGQPEEVTPNRENASTLGTKSPDGINRSEPSTPQPGDPQTFAQKLQLRVPSMESLFRSPMKESLFRSSKESLARTSSRESLNQLDLDCPAVALDPPSDMESEAEDAPGGADGLSREQLAQRLRRMERSLGSYRGKYSELVTAYQTLQREKKKLQGILSQSQDKALRRISELREELQMDQQAKKHLQEEFDASLEEKDQYISVLQTQVSLLKQRLRNGPLSVDVPLAQPEPQAEASAHTDHSEDEPAGGGAPNTLEALQQRVRRQENLLQRCKETIQSHKEQCTLLTSEKEALQEQLDERLQELEKIKGMVISETKRQMHETLELKDEEIVQLRSRIRQMTTQGEELREQKEKSERAAFEELERALAAAQRTEEAHRRLKAEMAAQAKAAAAASEQERAGLRQELARAKREAAAALEVRKSTEAQMAQLQKVHAEELASKEKALAKKLQAREKELQEHMQLALEKSQSEYLKLTQEKEQQESLALEEMELQKKAVLVESENRLQELQREAEAYRTRILELETSLEKSLQENKTHSEHLAVDLEAEKNKHNKEITIMVEKHRAEVENLRRQQDGVWGEQLQALRHQHQAELQDLRDQHEREKEALAEDRERLFQAHIHDMNEKTLGKLDAKQAELESLSAELAEVSRARDQLARDLAALSEQADAAKQELEARLAEQERRHQQEVDRVLKERETSVERSEKALQAEVSRLELLSKDKDEQARARQARVEGLEAQVHRCEEELQRAAAELDLLRSQHSAAHEHTAQLQQSLLHLETENNLLTQKMAEIEAAKKDACTELETHKARAQGLAQQLAAQSREMEEKVASLTQLHEAQLRDRDLENQQTKRMLAEKENTISQMREGHSRDVQALKHELSAKEEQTSRLHEEYEAKFKNQEQKLETMKQQAKEVEEGWTQKLRDQEARLRKELEATVVELNQNEKQLSAKIREMAQANSAGISDAVSRLEASQKEQRESLQATHARQLGEVTADWERKLRGQAEDLQEKHDRQMREKEQELAELAQKVHQLGREREELSQETARLREDGARQEAAVHELSVHAASLEQAETERKAQLAGLEADLRDSQRERASLQEQLEALTESRELGVSALADRSLQLQELLGDLALRLDGHCKKTEAFVAAKAAELMSVSSSKTGAILSRVSRCQQRTAAVRDALLLKTRRVSQLEAQLAQLTSEQASLRSAFQQASRQLEEKEHQIKSMKADIEGLLTEKEALQTEGGNQQRAASEKESCITQLRKELAENMNAVTLLREELAESKSEVGRLGQQVADLSAQLQGSVSLGDKEAALSALRREHERQQQELQAQLQELGLKADALSKEKTSALEQAERCASKLSEWKKKAQPRFAQYQSTIKELQAQLELKAEAAREKDEQIDVLKGDLDQQSRRCAGLQGELEAKKSNMEKERSLETEVEAQTARIVELEEHVAQKKKEIAALGDTLKDYSQQKDAEQRELARKLQHFQALGEEKDNRVREAEEKVFQLEKQVSSMEAELKMKKKELEDTHSRVQSKEAELKALHDRHELESAARLAELKKKAEQKVAAIRKQLLSQMEEKEQQYRKGAESRLSEVSAELQERERRVRVLEEKLKTLESAPQPEAPVLSRSVGNATAAGSEQEKAHSQGCGQKACKERLDALQRSLSEKEELLQRLERRKDEAVSSHSEAQSKYQELLTQLDLAEARQREDRVLISRLQEELKEKTNHSLIASQHVEEGGGQNNTGAKQSWETVVDGVQRTPQEKTLTCQTPEQKMEELEARRVEVEELTSKDEKLQAPQREPDGKSKRPEPLQDGPEERSKSPRDLEAELAGAEREKQKLTKEVATLQKDLRALRKEHQQELDLLRRESERDLQERVRQEQEDLELKHNSTLKQLMREFNTQLAQKEQELERTIKETIDKAQEVEAELLESHQEETNQLHKKIAEKDDALQRTAKRYEEILDAREEEMTAKVNELQAQLQELQKEQEPRPGQQCASSSDVTVEELQAQLAQKTSLISDSKLKEQELREQIHNLEDRLKKYEKNMYATSVGTPYKGGNLYHTDVSLLGEPTEFEYLRKVLFEYMMGRETKTMAKVITTVLKFPDEQTQKILEREDARLMSWLRTSP